MLPPTIQKFQKILIKNIHIAPTLVKYAHSNVITIIHETIFPKNALQTDKKIIVHLYQQMPIGSIQNLFKLGIELLEHQLHMKTHIAQIII
jgi:hypothetical protein